MTGSAVVLTVMDLGSGLPGLTPAYGEAMAEAAAVCLEDRGHPLKAELRVDGHNGGQYLLARPDVTDQMRRTWNDDQFTTEQGAYGVAILFVLESTDFTVIRRSRKGTGFDYWLGRSDDTLFRDKARLEVSGIRSGGPGEVSARTRQKLNQISASRGSLEGLVAIVEFGTPRLMVTFDE